MDPQLVGCLASLLVHLMDLEWGTQMVALLGVWWGGCLD